MASIQARARLHLSLPAIIDGILPAVLVAVGLVFSDRPMVWLGCLGAAFAVLVAAVLGGAFALYLVTLKAGSRIQGPRRKAQPLKREAFETVRSMFVGATLAAWPLSMWWQGHPTGVVWDLAPTGTSPLVATLAMLLGVLGMDAWLYWKHRLLHTRLLFPFHKNHHYFRDPTPVAGFAVGSLEAFLTFWPVLLVCIPQAVHWAPVYFILVVGFVVLNLYLHAGVTYRWVEATLPKVFLNTSAFHNIHHSHVKANFGEAMYLWDVICRTRLDDLQRGRGSQRDVAPPHGSLTD